MTTPPGAHAMTPDSPRDEDSLHAMNAALCEFATRWRMNGDYLHCEGCGRPIIASHPGALLHADFCKLAAITEANPWQTLLALLRPLTTAPRPGGQAVAWRLVRKSDGFVRSHIKHGPTPEMTMIAECDGEEWQPLYTAPERSASVEGLREGNWHHPDGGRIVGWVIEPDDRDRMGADAFCLPREVAEALQNLRDAARATAQGEGKASE